MDTVTQKPIIKEGGLLGAILDANETAANQPVVEPIVQTTPATETPVIPITTATAESNGTTSAPASEAVTTTEETNSSNFTIPDFDAPVADDGSKFIAPQPTQTVSQAVSWKDAIKTISQDEILKELGFDDFAIEIGKHRKNGGDPADYLFAKAIDYNKVSDAELIKNDLRAKYSQFSPADIDLLFNKKYGVSEDATDDEKAIASLELKADAHDKRLQKIAEQQKFKIAAPIATGPTPEQLQQEQIAVQQQAQLQQQALQRFMDHEATKNLMTSKRVALDLGNGISFNVNIDKPESLLRVITDGETWQKVTQTPQGEPDVVKQQKIALFALNPDKFITDIFNYGKTFGLKNVVEEGRNAGIEKPHIPGQINITEKEAWKNPKSGTVGGGR
jgi:hypothetical protein